MNACDVLFTIKTTGIQKLFLRSYETRTLLRVDRVAATHVGRHVFLRRTVRYDECTVHGSGEELGQPAPAAAAAGAWRRQNTAVDVLFIGSACSTQLASLLAEWHVHVLYLLFIITHGRIAMAVLLFPGAAGYP